jgi:hypothetical protein
MPSENNKQIALRWLSAFNTHNLDVLLSLYHDDAQHYSPKLKLRNPQTKGLIKGKAALRDWWQDAFKRLPTLRYEMLTLTADKNQIFMEYLRHVEGEEDMRVAELLVIEEDKIMASRVYHG